MSVLGLRERRALAAGPVQPRILARVIDDDVLERVLAGAVRTGADFAEVYAEDKSSTSAGLDDGRVEQVTSGRDRGAGIRVIAGETTGFAYTSDLSERGLCTAAAAAAAAASQGGGGVRTVSLDEVARRIDPTTIVHLPDTIAKARKVELLQRMNEAARSYGPEIVQVSAGYGDSSKRTLVANTDGVFADDEIIRTLLRISAVADGDTGMQTGYQSMGHTVGFEIFDTVDVEELARDAARQAITKLLARPAPSGAMPVVIKNGSGGVLFHEACGHGLEADLVAKDSSVYAGKVGQLVANPLVTLVDDGTMAGEWGTLGFDDEGHITQRNTLIEDGILTDYMWDYLRARKEGRPAFGQRSPSELSAPADGADDQHVRARRPRRPRRHHLRRRPNGVYVAKLGGGSVNTATGDFVFGMTEAYLIENGEITEPLREGQSDRQRPEGAAGHRHARQRLRDGQPRHMRQGRPGRAGRRRAADAARQGTHDRRNRRMSGAVSTFESELQAVADRVIAQAKPGEEVEAFVTRGGETEVRVYQGAVEHFVSAQSEGIGIRVISDGRTGFAYAGHARRVGDRRGAGRGARQRAVRRTRRVRGARRARRCCRSPSSRCGTRRSPSTRPTRRSIWPRNSRSWPRASIRVYVSTTRTTPTRTANRPWPPPRGIRMFGPRERLLRVGVDAGRRRRGRRRRDADRDSASPSVGRRPSSTSTRRLSEASERATRLLGATKPASKRLTVVLDPFVTAQFLGVISSTLNGEAVVKGRSLFRDRLGDEVAAASVTLVDDPTNPKAYSATDVDGEGLAARRNVLIEHGVLKQFVHNSYSRSSGRHGVDGQRDPRRVRRNAGRRLPGAVVRARHADAGRADRGCRRRSARTVRAGPALGRQPDQRRLLDGCSRPA